MDGMENGGAEVGGIEGVDSYETEGGMVAEGAGRRGGREQWMRGSDEEATEGKGSDGA